MLWRWSSCSFLTSRIHHHRVDSRCRRRKTCEHPPSDRALADLRAGLVGELLLHGSPGYHEATSPRNSTAHQAPAAVARVAGVDDVTTCVRWAVTAGLRVVVQATGHGAGRAVDDQALMVHTGRLEAIDIDAERRVARVGAGATFAAVNAAAWSSELLGLGGTAPDVGVAGYTFHGGLGWLTRPHGMASASLRAVEFVDGSGRVRRATSDADDAADREALWAFRGGGVGIATELELSLFSAGDLWAGYALWPMEHAEAVLGAWGEVLPQLHPSLTTSVGLLHAPTVPEQLRGHRVIHLCAASVDGEAAGRTLLDALAQLPAAALETFGACDAQRLSRIHLDPPAAVPALGEGRWLTAAAGARAAAILMAAGSGEDSSLSEIELRHVATPPSGVEGAMTDPPGEVLLHATGAAGSPADRESVQRGENAVLAAARAVDTGRGASAYRDGRESTLDAFGSAAQKRLAAVHRAVDSKRIFAVARPLADFDDLTSGGG